MTSNRQVCSDLPDLTTGETLRVIDVDRRFVPRADSVLVEIDNVPPDPVIVATGTTVSVEAFSGAACPDTLSSLPIRD